MVMSLNIWAMRSFLAQIMSKRLEGNESSQQFFSHFESARPVLREKAFVNAQPDSNEMKIFGGMSSDLMPLRLGGVQLSQSQCPCQRQEDMVSIGKDPRS